MKHILILLISLIIISGCANTAAMPMAADGSVEMHPDLKELEQSYLVMKLEVLQECDLDGRWVEDVARQRDYGVPMVTTANQVIDISARYQRKGHEIKTQDVLHRILLVFWVYDNYKSSPTEIYQTMFDDCENEMMPYIDSYYESQKRFMGFDKEENTLKPLGKENGIDFKDPTE